MGERLSNKPYLWSRYQIFMELNRDYNTRAKDLIAELETKTEISESYVKHVKGKLLDQYTEAQINENIADLCLKECHAIMIVGWEIDK